MTNIFDRTRNAVKANPKRKSAFAPVNPRINEVYTLDELIGKRIICHAPGRDGIETQYTGEVIDYKQVEYSNEVDTWLFIKLAGWLNPQPVHYSRIVGFQNMFTGVR